MRNLPIECLRSFATVAEVKGFTQAGQLLGKSQPAVSLQIKRLEELIGAQVFVRGSHRLELTQPGERMLDYARQILALNDEALAELALPAISGRVRFGLPSEYATILLPKVLGRFSHSYPAVTLEIHCDLSANLLAEDQAGTIVYEAVENNISVDGAITAGTGVKGTAQNNVGVIAGTQSINPILSTLLPDRDDGKVSVAATRVEGMNDHLELPVTHVFMMRDDEVMDQVIYYLANGRFKRELH